MSKHRDLSCTQKTWRLKCWGATCTCCFAPPDPTTCRSSRRIARARGSSTKPWPCQGCNAPGTCACTCPCPNPGTALLFISLEESLLQWVSHRCAWVVTAVPAAQVSPTHWNTFKAFTWWLCPPHAAAHPPYSAQSRLLHFAELHRGFQPSIYTVITDSRLQRASGHKICLALCWNQQATWQQNHHFGYINAQKKTFSSCCQMHEKHGSLILHSSLGECTSAMKGLTGLQSARISTTSHQKPCTLLTFSEVVLGSDSKESKELWCLCSIPVAVTSSLWGWLLLQGKARGSSGQKQAESKQTEEHKAMDAVEHEAALSTNSGHS